LKHKIDAKKKGSGDGGGGGGGREVVGVVCK
jgi:hypothetical protein